MTTLRKVLPFTLLALVALWTSTRQAQAQNNPDCSFTHQFTGDDATWTGVSNLSGNTPCVNWRVTYSVPATDTLTTQVTIQTSPDRVTWTSVPNSLCAAAVQPPCVWQGTNPTASGAQGMVYAALYGNYVRVITSGSAGAGTATVRAYGAKGATANANIINGPGTGTVTNVSFTGGLISVANPTTAPALTVAGTSGGIPYFSSASTWASSGLLSLNGVVLGGGAGGAPTVTAADNTTTHALFATAGAPAFRAIVPGDIPGLVPYTGATADLNLGPHNETVGQTSVGTTVTLTAIAGASQGTSVPIFAVQNNLGAQLFGVNLQGIAFLTGNLASLPAGNGRFTLDQNLGLLLGSPSGVSWSSVGDSTQTPDLGISRNAAGVLEVNNGTPGTFADLLVQSVRLNPGATVQPTCDVTQRGKFWDIYGGAGVKDQVQVCAKDATDTYAWRTIY